MSLAIILRVKPHRLKRGGPLAALNCALSSALRVLTGFSIVEPITVRLTIAIDDQALHDHLAMDMRRPDDSERFDEFRRG